VLSRRTVYASVERGLAMLQHYVMSLIQQRRPIKESKNLEMAKELAELRMQILLFPFPFFSCVTSVTRRIQLGTGL